MTILIRKFMFRIMDKEVYGVDQWEAFEALQLSSSCNQSSRLCDLFWNGSGVSVVAGYR